MPRLIDLPDPYAIVVMLPGVPPSTNVVNGRIARMIAWLLDHRDHVEAMRGAATFNFGDRGFQVELRENFPYQNVSGATPPRVVTTVEEVSVSTDEGDTNVPSVPVPPEQPDEKSYG